MRKITVERKTALWDELIPEQQTEEIEKLTNEKDGLLPFFEDAFIQYDYALKDIEAETLQENPAKYKAVKFIRDKVNWQSGSQGWYYDHCSVNDFLVCKDFFKRTKKYTLELCDAWRYEEDKTWVSKCAFRWRLTLVKDGIENEWAGEFSDIQAQVKHDGWKIPAEAARSVLKREARFCEEFRELQKRIEDEIKYYDQYWPSDEEIGDLFRLNEVEFVIEENETERVAI